MSKPQPQPKGPDTSIQDDKDGAKTSKAVTANAPPPKEASASIWTRRLVVSSFWAVVVLLGLPIWWWTTTVYRAELPLKRMSDWAAGNLCQPTFPLRAVIEAPEFSTQDEQSIIDAAQKTFDLTNTLPAHELRLSAREAAGDIGRMVPAITVRLASAKGVSSPEVSIGTNSKILTVAYPMNKGKGAAASASLGEFVGAQLQQLFAEEKAILQYLLSSLGSQTPSDSLAFEMADTLTRRTTRSMKYAPTFHLTFSLFTPEASPSSWDIEQALEQTILPLLRSYSSISNFSIDTQVQPYAGFSPDTQPVYDEGQKAWVINRDALGGFINAAEWPLSPSIGTGPTINFLVYVPSETQTPLVVNSTSRNSWLVPQWGGVAILNLKKRTAKKKANMADLTTQDLEPTMLVFSQQLLSLLGVPTSPENSLELRLSALTRIHATSLLLSASKTLGSLARLTQQLPSISIPDSAAEAVVTTLTRLDAACKDLKLGHFQNALENARVADWHAEKAFFEKSMVGQVYFPEEHKVAVYLPLLGPVAVPLVMSLIKELRPFLQRVKRA